jgi:hypothetical protein
MSSGFFKVDRVRRSPAAAGGYDNFVVRARARGKNVAAGALTVGCC